MPLTKLNQAREILETIIDEPPEQRAEMLARLCAGDEALRDQLTRVLKEVDGDVFMATPLVTAPDGSEASAPGPSPVLRRIRSYELIRMIGEGGMGAVYEARQENPRRMVALKVLRAGLFSAEASRRFQRESQLLGLLHHPAIAQVFEAGTAITPLGEVPYFAMELVRGVTLSTYLVEHPISVRGRLQLLATICDAVEHAHRQGVVHRDLKPANILIEVLEDAQAPDQPEGAADNSLGRPKVLDFGVARAVGTELLAGATIQTGVGQIVGTLSYMSPEQVSGNPDQVDARCDVYSLGVVAYEMLSGRLPIDVRGKPFPDVTKSILHDEPTRLRSIDSRLGGDIDTIVAKAIEKDPVRRYQSAAALAADIRRFLRDEPIVARPATSLYQLRKFARRNRTVVAGVLATFVTLLAGAITTAYWAVRATERSKLVQQRADELQRKVYRASIAATQAAIERGQTDAGRAHLADAPVALRGWEWHYLESMMDRSDRTFNLTAMGFKHAALDADWAFFQGGPRDRLVNWVDGRSVECESSGVIDAIYALSVSPRGDRFAVCGAVRTALYDATTGTIIRVFPGEPRFETQAFSRDGRIMVGASIQPQELLVFDAQSGETLRSIPLEGAVPAFPALSPVEDLVAVEISPGVVGLMELESGKVGHRFSGVQPRFSADGRLVLAFDGVEQKRPSLQVRDVKTGQSLASLPVYTEFVASRGAGSRLAALSPDGATLAVLGMNSAVSLYDMPSQRLIGVMGGLPLRQGGAFAGVSFSPDGRWLAGVPGHRAMKVWDLFCSFVPAPQSMRQELSYSAATLSPDGTLSFTGDWGQITAWNALTNAPIWSIFPSFEFRTSMACSPDGKRVLCGGDRGSVLLIDAANGAVLADATPHGVGPFGSNWVTSLDWIRGSNRFAAGFVDGHVAIVDAETMKVVHEINFPEGEVEQVAVAPSGNTIAVVVMSSPRRVALLSGDTLEETASFEISEASSLAWSPDERRLAVGRNAGLTVCRPIDGTVIDYEGARNEQSCVAFSPDGARIVSGSIDGGLAVWDAVSGDLAIELPLPRTDVSIVVGFTPDGSGVVTATTTTPATRFETGKPMEADALAREIARRAREEVARIITRTRFARETVAVIESTAGMDERVRTEAVRQLRVLDDHAATMNNSAYVRARSPIDEASLQIALRECEAAIERCSDAFGVMTRAIVLYRARRYEESIALFERADAELRRTRANWGEGTPELAGFRAMAEAALGRTAEAEQWTARFERVSKEPRYRDQPETTSLAAELGEVMRTLRSTP